MQCWEALTPNEEFLNLTFTNIHDMLMLQSEAHVHGKHQI